MVDVGAFEWTEEERPLIFESRRDDLWQRTYATRLQCARDKAISFSKLTPRTSSAGALFGARFFQPRRWFGKRDILNITLCNDRFADDEGVFPTHWGWAPSSTGYSVWAHRPGYEPVALGSANGADEDANAADAADMFAAAVAETLRCKALGPLSETMPAQWHGKNWKTIFAEETFAPNKQAIATTIMFMGFVVPASLLLGKSLSYTHVMALAGGLFWLSCLVAVWLGPLLNITSMKFRDRPLLAIAFGVFLIISMMLF